MNKFYLKLELSDFMPTLMIDYSDMGALVLDSLEEDKHLMLFNEEVSGIDCDVTLFVTHVEEMPLNEMDLQIAKEMAIVSLKVLLLNQPNND